jgi:hypothetical protein
MPSKYLITSLERKGFVTMEQLCEAVDHIRQQYQSMMVNMDEYMVENPHVAKEPGAIMDIMDGFYRLIPLPIRVGLMCFKCTSTKGSVWYTCDHSTIATILFDPAMEVPQSATRIKDRSAKVRTNPFNPHRREETMETASRNVQESFRTPPSRPTHQCWSPPPRIPSKRAWTRARARARPRASRE